MGDIVRCGAGTNVIVFDINCFIVSDVTYYIGAKWNGIRFASSSVCYNVGFINSSAFFKTLLAVMINVSATKWRK